MAVVLALAVVMCGCERGATDTTGPDIPPLTDKRPCPIVHLTYADPNTIDPAWSGGIKDFSFIWTGESYHLFHITDPATGWTSRNGELSIGHASTPGLGEWTTHPCIDLLTDAAGWSPSFTWAPHVIKNDADGLYYMFYTGVKWATGAPIDAAEQRIGLARSSDLMTWTPYDVNGEDGLILDGPDHEEFPWSAFDTDGVSLPWEYDCRDPFIFDRGSSVTTDRYVMLASIRLAPDATSMAIAYATSDDLVSWQWQNYFPVTVGWKAESANLVERNGVFYLFWTKRGDADAVKVAFSTTGIFGSYAMTNGGDWLFGIANETLVEPQRTLYLAFDDAFFLHIKADIVFPATPTYSSPVEITEVTGCSSDFPRPSEWF
ncbi:MAG: hypothetical protein R3D98_11970 [Candidatus Krumholzibacteriia bacterium]